MAKTVDIVKSNRNWSRVIGFGLAIAPIHNLWLTNLFSTSKGETVVFLPAFGAIFWIMGSLLFIVQRWQKGDRWQDWLGDWRIFVPLLIIALFMGISGFINGEGINGKVAPLLMGLALFAVYVTARKLGASLFRWLMPFVILGAVIAIVLGMLNPGIPASQTNGLITNYCACAGFLIFGTVVNQGKWQWALAALVLVGVFFIGALESVFILGVLGIAVLVRRDFSKHFLIVAGLLVLLVGLWAVLGHLVALYTGNNNLSVLNNIVSGTTPLTYNTAIDLTSGRWEPILNAIRDIHFFGHGYTLSLVSGGIVHNIPLIIVHQIGPIAGLAWLFVSIWCLVKTKWKYAWIALLAMCIFDHYFWTQLYPLWFCLIGVSATSTIKSDLIFRKATK